MLSLYLYCTFLSEILHVFFGAFDSCVHLVTYDVLLYIKLAKAVEIAPTHSLSEGCS